MGGRVQFRYRFTDTACSVDSTTEKFIARYVRFVRAREIRAIPLADVRTANQSARFVREFVLGRTCTTRARRTAGCYVRLVARSRFS